MATKTVKKPVKPSRVTPKKLVPPSEVVIDVDAISWDDMQVLEEQGILVMDELAREGSSFSIKLIKGFIWLELRKTRPDVTLAEVGKLPFSKTNLVQGGTPSPT